MASSGGSGRAKSRSSSSAWTSEPRTSLSSGGGSPVTADVGLGARRLAGGGHDLARRGDARQAELAREVEAVAAAGVVGERRVREPALGRRGARGHRDHLRLGGQRGARRAATLARGGRGDAVLGREQPDGDRPVAARDRRVGRDRPGAAEQRGREPVDRRRAAARDGPLRGVDAAREDQPLLRAGGGDVEQAPLLGRLGLGQRGGDPLPAERRHRLPAGEREQPQPGVAVLADQQPVAAQRAGAPEVGDADDRELEPLGAVDRHQPHGVEALGLERRLALARLGEVLADGVAQEAAQVAALRALVLAREPHQLAQVREPAVAAGAGEDREVVAGVGDRALEQHLDGQPLAAQPLARREAGEAGEPRRRVPGQRLEPRRTLGDRAPQRGPRALALAAGRVRQQRERIGADAAERRRQHRVERALLVRVGEQRQVGDAVADLLLRPVAAAADHVGAEPLLLQRLLVEPQRARRADEHDDVALRAAGVDLLAQPGGDRAGLRAAPWLRGERGEPEVGGALVPAGGLDGEQLDRRRAGRVGLEQPQHLRRATRDERREAAAEQRPDRGVHHRQDLLSRPEVDGEAAHA